MDVKCLIIDTDRKFYDIAVSSLSEMCQGKIEFTTDIQRGLQSIHAKRPNMIFIRCGAPGAEYESLFHVIKRMKIPSAVIPVITKPTKESLAAALNMPGVVDLIAGDIDEQRITQVVQRALERLDESHQSDTPQQFRGFAAFVGVTPTLIQRKILSETSMGLIHNRSLRLAIEYWRKNPTTPVAALMLNPLATFSSRDDEQIDGWMGHDLLPWEIAMFEAQIFYMAYWREAIAHELMPPMIPTLLQMKDDVLMPLRPDLQSETLSKIDDMTRRGQLNQALQAMGVALRGDGAASSQVDFKEYLRILNQNLAKVEQKFPYLTRGLLRPKVGGNQATEEAPTADGSIRMAYVHRNRS